MVPPCASDDALCGVLLLLERSRQAVALLRELEGLEHAPEALDAGERVGYDPDLDLLDPHRGHRAEPGGYLVR